MNALMGAAAEGVRIGSVPYLNAAPLVHGLGESVRLAPPSQLARWLRSGEVDAGLVSITEVLEQDLYEVVDGVGVVSDGPVFSVYLAHHGPLDSLSRVACDPASLTSVRLLQWLLAHRGLRPEFVRMDASAAPEPGVADAFLLIGDPAIAFRQSPSAAESGVQIWDLGAAWKEATGLPFVYAVWAVRRDRVSAGLIHRLREAGASGQRHLDDIIRDRPEFDVATRNQYLRHHIRHSIGDRERAGVVRFAQGLNEQRIARTVPVRWVGGN
jgi:predicted solute-binding protein